MRRCFDLARLGRAKVQTNPVVGSLLIGEGKVLSEGYHEAFGGPHAEVNTLAKIPLSDDLADTTLYVSLEPCSHHGKTPPCSELVVKRGVGEVIVSIQDPSSKVNGKGVQHMRSHGVKVSTGCAGGLGYNVIHQFCRRLRTGRPYVILKWAESADGFLGAAGVPTRISHPITDRLVHKWRAECDAILVGSGTALTDNPSLTTRLFHGSHPLRVLVDRRARANQNLNLFDGTAPTIRNS